MGLASFTRRLTRRRAQLTFFSGVVAVCLLVIVFLATQVFLKLGDYAAANQDNTPWSLARLEVEQMKMLAALSDLELGNPDSINLLHRRFDALYSRHATLGVGKTYQPLMAHPKARAVYDQLSTSIEAMEVIMDSPDSVILANRSELARLTNLLSSPIQRLSSIGISTDAQLKEHERRALTNKLLQVTVLSVMLLLAMIALAVLLWSLYRLYRQRAFENRQTLGRLETILNTSQDAVLVVCPEGKVIDTNRAADTMFYNNAPHEDRADISQILFEKQPDGALSGVSGTKLLGSCKDGPNLCTKLIAQNPAGEKFPIELSANTALRGDTQVVICFIRNIARRMADQAELLAARDRALSGEKAKARFLGTISHEMRTPLTGMLGALDLLDSTAMSTKQKTYAQIMQSSGQVLLNQINDALDVAQADQGGVALSSGVFDLDASLDALVTAQRPLAHKAGNSLRRVGNGPPLGKVTGDRNRVYQIILNLVSNAIKFTVDGEITVDGARITSPNGTADMVEFQIIDTGIGIAEDDQARIFEDFVRLENAEALNIEGTGLGLGIVRNLVVLMGGEIGVESVPGEGSLFWVRLPLPAALGKLAEPPALNLPAKPGPRNVLIVEDNEINRTVLAELLEKEGHHVWTAPNGADGTNLAAKRRFDVILMDINMPVLDGISAARQIRANADGASHAARIVALSAYVTPETKADVGKAGFDAVLTKPLRREDLEHALLGSAPAREVSMGTIIDETILAQLHEALSPEILEQLLTGFTMQGADLLSELDQLKGEDLPARLHDLAGLSATLGARALHTRLSQAELALRAGDAKGAVAALDALPAVWKATITQLSEQRAAA